MDCTDLTHEQRLLSAADALCAGFFQLAVCRADDPSARAGSTGDDRSLRRLRSATESASVFGTPNNHRGSNNRTTNPMNHATPWEHEQAKLCVSCNNSGFLHFSLWVRTFRSSSTRENSKILLTVRM